MSCGGGAGTRTELDKKRANQRKVGKNTSLVVGYRPKKQCNAKKINNNLNCQTYDTNKNKQNDKLTTIQTNKQTTVRKAARSRVQKWQCTSTESAQASFVCLFICLFVCLLVCLFVCLFLCSQAMRVHKQRKCKSRVHQYARHKKRRKHGVNKHGEQKHSVLLTDA